MTRAQLECVESPVRIAIWGALRALGPSSIKDLARYVGRRPDALYYHVRHLERCGLVTVHERRPSGTRHEAVYRLTAPEFRIQAYGPDRRYRRSALRLAENAVRKATRHYRTAVSGLDGGSSAKLALDFHMVNARLTKPTLARLKRDLDRLLRRALRDEGEKGSRVMLVALLTPVSKG